MKLPPVILVSPPELYRNEILICTDPPYIMGKLVKFSNNTLAADDYDAKSKIVDYFITRIPGYDIFVTHAGYFETPLGYVDEKTVAYKITEMAEWYRVNILTKKRQSKIKTFITNKN